MRELATPAVVLRAVDYGESDRIVTFLTRDAGKIAGIAKGAKRSQRRFAGGLGLFSHIALHYRHRPGADLVFLERVQILHPWKRLLDSLERYAAASHVIELADKMTLENEVGDDLYRVVLAALRRIDRAEPGPATLRLFELATLAACGYRSEWRLCVLCRRPLDVDRVAARVAPAAGGAACGGCASSGSGETGVTLSAGALAGLLAMQAAIGRPVSAGACPFDDEDSIATALGRDGAREVGLALSALIAPHLRGRLLSAALLGPVVRGGIVSG